MKIGIIAHMKKYLQSKCVFEAHVGLSANIILMSFYFILFFVGRRIIKVLGKRSKQGISSRQFNVDCVTDSSGEESPCNTCLSLKKVVRKTKQTPF